MLESIPTLSLWEPWCSLVFAGFKHDETRHWPTKVRGRIALHAAMKCDHEGAPYDLCVFAFGPDWVRTRPRGAVLGVATLAGCAWTAAVADHVAESNWLAGNFDEGRFAFRLEDVRPLREPIPARGAQGFWRWTPPADLEERLLPAVDQEAAARRWAAANAPRER